MHLNRVVAVAATVISLLLAVLPVLANFDWTSTAGIIAGVVAVLGITQKWLDGWQKHEERAAFPLIAGVDAEGNATLDSLPPDQGDVGRA